MIDRYHPMMTYIEKVLDIEYRGYTLHTLVLL